MINYLTYFSSQTLRKSVKAYSNPSKSKDLMRLQIVQTVSVRFIV